jgi:hypothetical protein
MKNEVATCKYGVLKIFSRKAGRSLNEIDLGYLFLKTILKVSIKDQFKGHC